MRQLELTHHGNKRLAKLCGQFDENLHSIEPNLGVEINNWGSDFEVIGIFKSVDKAAEVLKASYKEAAYLRSITPNEVLLRIREMDYLESETKHKEKVGDYELKAHQLRVKARIPNQQYYLNTIQKYDISFSIGPSGTGKTFLAVACGVSALEKEEVSRIIPTRPAVGANGKLAYLSGDLTQKNDPYLRPLYDVLFEMIGKVSQLSEKGIIEIVLSLICAVERSMILYIILDETQNATGEQMKMFLTCIGFGLKPLSQETLRKRIC